MSRSSLPTERFSVVVPQNGRFSGLVTFVGDAQIDGELDGKVVAKGTLVLAETARVNAEIEVGELIVAGRLEGEVRARRVELLPAARVRGSIEAEALVLAEGSLFEGRCSAGSKDQRGEDASEPAPKAAAGGAGSS
jgi:cytoskeletal protein CcmA (bactofilin family)